MAAPKLTRQCADPQSFFETHFEAEIPIPVDMTVHQYFSRLSLAYAFCVKRSMAGVQSQTKQTTALILRNLDIPNTTYEDERCSLLDEAKRLNTEAQKPTVHQGAAVADMISTVYGYIARCAAQRLQANGQLALTCTPNNAEAIKIIEEDLADPTISYTMLQKIDDVNPTALDEVRRMDLDKLREHLALWRQCSDLQMRVKSFVKKLHANIVRMTI